MVSGTSEPTSDQKINLDITNLFSNDKSSVSTLRSTASQFCAIIASGLLTLSFGMSIGFSTILIPDLYKKDAEINVTIDELTWISSLNYLSVPLGAVISGPICKFLGRRNILILATLPYMASWLLFRFSGTTAWPIFLGFVLSGISGGLVEGPVQIYVTEVSETRLRGSISALITSTILIGIFLQTLIGSYVHWRTLALINFAFPAIAIVILNLVPESPYWLAMKGRTEAAQRALSWLRGWIDPGDVKLEYEIILQSFRNEVNTDAKRSTNQIFKRYFRRSVTLPFLIVTFAFFINCFNGNVSIITYAVPMFAQLDIPIDEYTATMILAASQMVAAMLLIFIVPKTGKRKPTFASLSIAGLALLTVAIHTHLRDQEIILKENDNNWIPLVTIVIAIIATALGIRGIPWILAGELFPSDARDVAAGFVGATWTVYAALASKAYIYMVDAFTLAGTFLFFACINFMGLIVLYYTMPETEGKTLAEIEDYFMREKKGVKEVVSKDDEFSIKGVRL